MKRTRKRKRLRKQPRKLTPPLVLRDDRTGEVHIVEVDHEHVTTNAHHSRRISAILHFGSALKISVGSRSVNKRRVPVLHIQNALTYNMP
jgi:hypothetical protein